MEQKISNRLVYIDIMKSFLIVFVVIGHTYVSWTQYIYWFHMPVFFMISGHFLKFGNVFDYCKKDSFLCFYLIYLLDF